MWTYVKQQVLQQLFQKRQVPQDDSGNAQDDLADGTAPVQSK